VYAIKTVSVQCSAHYITAKLADSKTTTLNYFMRQVVVFSRDFVHALDYSIDREQCWLVT